MKHFGRMIAVAAIALGASVAPSFADQCSGHSHDTGTAIGAGGGALIGGLASHSIVGAVAGGVVGGFAGNAVARSEDCNHHRARVRQSYYIDSDGHRHYYTR